MFCIHCGKELEENETKCSNCGGEIVKETKTEPKQKIKLSPLSILGLVFSSLALLFGFVLVTCSFATGFGMGMVDIIVFIPMFVGIAVGVYDLVKSPANKNDRLFSIVTLSFSGFTLLYTLIGYIVMFA